MRRDRISTDLRAYAVVAAVLLGAASLSALAVWHDCYWKPGYWSVCK